MPVLVTTCAIVRAASAPWDDRKNRSNDGRNPRLIEDILREEASTLGQEPAEDVSMKSQGFLYLFQLDLRFLNQGINYGLEANTSLYVPRSVYWLTF